MAELIGILFLLALGGLALWLLTASNAVVRSDEIEARSPLMAAEFGQQFFPRSPELAAEVHRLIALQMGDDRTKMRPEDEITDEHVLGSDLDPVELLMTLEDRYQVQFDDDEARHIETVGDLVEATSAKLETTQRSPESKDGRRGRGD